MPWRGPEVPGEFPTLGYQIGDWIEARCVIPDGDHMEEPYLLTDEMWRFLLWYYRLDPNTGRFMFDRGGQLVRPQKWGKGPFAASITCAEAGGPVVPDGWDAYGEPVGRPWATPWIQITAVSEDQTDNTWRALQPMIELGALRAEIPDTGLTRINLPGGGLIEPVTSAAPSRLGQRITFAVQDETHSWTRQNKTEQVADTQRRNLAGMNGRWLETTNAWDPSEHSVAQQTFESQLGGVYKDFIQPPDSLSHENKRERRRMLKAVYGDSWWVTLDRIDSEFQALAEKDTNQALRFFCNKIMAGAGAAIDPLIWAKLHARGRDQIPPAGTRIGVGFDGSISEDATGLVGCTPDGYLFELAAWLRPERTKEWRVPRLEVHEKLAWIFDRYQVGRMYADPPKWWTELEQWAQQYGEETVLAFDTNQDRRMGPAVDRFLTAYNQAEISHDGSAIIAAHLGAARLRKARARDQENDSRTLYTLTKGSDGRKIDLGVAAVLAHEAAMTMPAELVAADPLTQIW